MELHELQATASLVISASPEDLYSFIADMPRVGEVSPVCTGGTWETESRGLGATFIGSNTRGERTWQARRRVVVAEPSAAFAWDNVGEATAPLDAGASANARWTYTFEPVDGGTLVTESWEVLPGSRVLEALDNPRVASLPGMTQGGMEETLENLKKVFES